MKKLRVHVEKNAKNISAANIFRESLYPEST